MENSDSIFTIEIDVNRNTHPISPLVYGLSWATTDHLAQLRPTLTSWGGNATTRYNWQHGRAWNAASDWFYRNGNYGYTTGSAADQFIAEALATGTEVRLALPTLGWVAKDDNNDTCSFPLPDGGCGNADGANCENPDPIADPTRANVPSSVDSITQWVQHLYDEKGFDIRFLAMDNEPELWGYTHYDVHPTCTTYDEILEKYLAYATAVRAVAPQAELTGPVTCCWYYYWNSAAGTSDKEIHHNQDFLPWFLDQVRQHDETAGIRTLDVLDIHYYPEGLYNSEVDAETAVHRLRSTRSLWDPAYTDESWINEPIYLIPRMKQLIEAHYPGTKLGISEWNWGVDETMNGSLAIADVLGILGREDVYFAAYWAYPPLNSPGFYAFKLYSNYDNQGSRFADTSVWAQSNDVDVVSSYAALSSRTGDLQVMLVQKQTETAVPVQINLTNFSAAGTATLYRYDQTNPDGIVTSSLSFEPDNFHITLPPYSITLLVLENK